MQQTVRITEAKSKIAVELKGLVCAITSDKQCNFSLYVGHSIISSSKEGVMYFTEQYIENLFLFKAGQCLEKDHRLVSLDAVNLCSWRYEGFGIICDTPNVTLTIHTIPIWMFLSVKS